VDSLYADGGGATGADGLYAGAGGRHHEGMTTPSFEQGPIRPPSEAASLLVRVVRNCGWNRCRFCPVYKGCRFSVRPLADVLADVEAMKAAADLLTAQPMSAVLHGGLVPPAAFQVALFLRDGGRAVFLQDADPCAVSPDKLATVIESVRRAFPTVTRVTTYGRAATLARRRPPALARLCAAGLTRVHLGMESGSDEVLARVDKGCTAAQLVTAGRRVLEAGLELCLYVMPGLGGRDLAGEHEHGTAAVLREVAAAAPPARPLVVRLRTTAVVPGTPLAADEAAGRFALPDDVEVAAELRSLLELLDGVRLELRSDHALNLMADLEGTLPADRERLIDLLDGVLALAPEEQAEFALGVRLGVYRTPRDLRDGRLRQALRECAPGAGEAAELGKLDAAKRLRSRFL
jgi:hypothetical protein